MKHESIFSSSHDPVQCTLTLMREMYSSFSLATHASPSRGPAFVLSSGIAAKAFLVDSSTMLKGGVLGGEVMAVYHRFYGCMLVGRGPTTDGPAQLGCMLAYKLVYTCLSLRPDIILTIISCADCTHQL